MGAGREEESQGLSSVAAPRSLAIDAQEGATASASARTSTMVVQLLVVAESASAPAMKWNIISEESC